MVGVFFRLKLRLLLNGFRADTARLVGFLIGIVFAVVFAGGAAFGLAQLRAASPDVAVHVGVIVFTVLALGWAFLPLLMFGTDETLDPARLTPLPLRRRTLLGGLLVSALIGIPPLATLFVLAGAVTGLSGGVGSVLVGLVALALELALCIGLSRALSASLSGLLRSRRGRDLGVLLGLLLVFGVQGINVAFSQADLGDGSSPRAFLGFLSTVAAPLRWTPPGVAAHAIGDAAAGRYPLALGELAITAAAVALVMWWWSAALGRALVGYDASTQGGAVRTRSPLGGLVAGWLLSGRTGAVASKELRYFWRDPQRKAGLFGAVAVAFLLAFSVNGGSDAGFSTTSAQFAPCFTALILGLQSSNQFGLDGAAWWMNLVATGRPRDFRSDMSGKNLAVSIVGVPLILLICVALALLRGHPWAMATAFGAGCGFLGISLGISTVTSVLAPYPVPERRNAFSSPGSGRGLITFASNIGTLILAGVVGLPILLPLIFLGRGSLVVLVLAPIYGGVFAWLGRRLAAQIGYPRMPELLGQINGSKAS